jgi:putative DNA primase/helicase
MTNTVEIGSDVELAKLTITQITDNLGDFFFDDSQFWTYQETEWAILTVESIHRIIMGYDGALFGEKGIVKLNQSRLKSITAIIMGLVKREGFFTDPKAGINCLNGFIEFGPAGARRIPHDRAHACRHTIQANWHKKVDLTGSKFAKYLKVLGNALGDQNLLDLLQEVGGAAVAGYGARLIQSKAIILIGPDANNGKSEWMELLCRMVPASAATTLPPGDFKRPEYRVHLVGKLLNTADELSTANVISSDLFKTIITGNRVNARDLYLGMVSFKPKALHVFAANRRPSFIGGLDAGVRRRLLLIAFAKSIPEEDRVAGIVDTLIKDEMELVLSWMVEGASRLITNGRYTIPASLEEALQEWDSESDTAKEWITNRVRQDPTAADYTEFGLYRHYKFWAEERGYGKYILGKKEFVARFKEVMPGVIGKRTTTSKQTVHGIRVLATDNGEDHYEAKHPDEPGEMTYTSEVIERV